MIKLIERLKSDMSHAGAKRLSVEMYTASKYATLNDVKAAAIGVLEKYKKDTFCRSDIVRAHFGDRPPDVIWIEIAKTKRKAEDSKWFFRLLYINPELPETERPLGLNGEDRGPDGISIWSQRFGAL